MRFTVLVTAFGLASAASTVLDEEFVTFLVENGHDRKLQDEVNDNPTQNAASTKAYTKLKDLFCQHKDGDCEPGRERRLNAPPPMPAYLFPDPHVGSAANFSFPCYPYDPADGWTVLESNDDMSFELILPFDFKLYGTDYPAGTSIYLNNNGNLSFDNAISSFSASGFPINSPMIAPFWSDVDTTGGIGAVYYKFFPDNKLAVIWDQVGYFPARDNRRNTFQVVISDAEDPDVGLGTNVCFCYVDMDWTTGGASGGVQGFGGRGATVGVNRGMMNDYIQIGQFNDTGTQHDGPGGEFDGVDYLDFKGSNVLVENVLKKGICFEATGLNIPPFASDFPADNYVSIPCGSALDITVSFASPELQQDITVQTSNVPDGMVVNQQVSLAMDNVNVNLKWKPDHATQHGIHEVTFFCEDNYIVPANITQVLKIDVAECASPEPDVPIRCAPLSDSQCTEGVGPNCTPFRSPEHCFADESFPLLITNRRVQAFENPAMVEFEGFWFHTLEDKAAQHAFTASSGYPAPELYCCVTETSALEDSCFAPGHNIPDGFTIRATGGHSGKGIYVLPYGFGGIDLISGHAKSLSDIESELGTNVDKILVEQFIDGSEMGEVPSLPTEYKFHMFNGKIGAIDVIHNRGTSCSCYAVVDDDFNRLDKFGCFFPQPAFGLDADDDSCYDIDFSYGEEHPYQFKGQDLCGAIDPPCAPVWDALKDLATALSTKLGVYMRIDLFLSGNNQIYVQEYTSNHAGGLRHCAAKKTESGCIDSCFLGKLWKSESSGGTMYGGPQTALPTILEEWSKKTDLEQCTASLGAAATKTFSQPSCPA